LNYHRLKPVVSRREWEMWLCSCEVELPPAKAGGVQARVGNVVV
jgi:hypothetical protein